MARVFISHASENAERAARIHGWLMREGHEVFLAEHPQEGIAVGDEWEQRLYERLRWADAVVCLVTSEYLSSPWCTAEVGIARARGSRVLPLLAEHGVAHPLLHSQQYADFAADPHDSYARLRTALHLVDAVGGLGWPDSKCPFPGLRPFDADLHQVFFGRERDIQELTALLRSPAEQAAGRVRLVVGPSGCGKSSFARAGVLPSIASEPGWWTLPPVLPGTNPVSALARELAVEARRLGLSWTVQEVRDRLHADGDELPVLVDELLLAAPGPGRRRRLLILVDQFEELLTQSNADRRTRFAELLRPAMAGQVQVMATMRPEFLAPLLDSQELAGLPASVFMLRPLARETLPAVVEGPAQLAGIGIDKELVTRLVSDTDSGDALPLLAFTLSQLAAGVGRGDRLSFERYDRLGGVQGALIHQAEASLANATATGGRTRGDVISSLLRLVTVDEQGRPTRWRINRGELPAPVAADLDVFAAGRLLTIDSGDNDETVIGVAHEAFLSAWPPLADAISANVSALRMRRAVEHAAAEWDAADRPVTQLWERNQLAAALTDTGACLRTTRRAAGVQLDDERRAAPVRTRWPGLLPARTRVLTADKVELSPRARRFLHASIRRDRRRRARALSIVSVLLFLAVIAAGVALLQRQTAQQQKLAAEGMERVAIAHGLVARADAIRDSDPRTALQLGIAAQHIHADDETQASLVNTLTATHYEATLPGHHHGESAVAFAPDGQTVAGAGMDRSEADTSIMLWDISDRARPRQLGRRLAGYNDAVYGLAFTPDGRTLAAGDITGTIILWDVTDRSRPRRLGRPLSTSVDVRSIALTSDKRTLATGNADGTISLWDVANPMRPRWLSTRAGRGNFTMGSVAFTPDGALLASGDEGGEATVWEVTDRRHPRRASQIAQGDEVTWAFAPRGRTLATSSAGKTVLWDVTDSAQPRRIGQPRSGLAALPMSGRGLPTGGGPVVVWDVSDTSHPRPVGQAFTMGDNPADSFAVAWDGRTLATGGYDGVVLWDVPGRATPSRLGGFRTGRGNTAREATYSPDGHILATGMAKTTLWDVTDPSHLRRIGQPLPGGAPAFSPNHHILTTLTTEGNGTVIWELSDPTRPRRLGPPLPDMSKRVFSPDGRTLAGQNDSDLSNVSYTTILWDLSDPLRPRRLGQAIPGLPTAFSADGTTLITVGDEVILWDVSDPAHPRQLGKPLSVPDTVQSAAYSPGRRMLATTDQASTVILWDVSDQIRPHRLGHPLTLITGNTTGGWELEISPDGRTLLADGPDGALTLWDVTDQANPRILSLPVSGPMSSDFMSFSPDARTYVTVASVGRDESNVSLWSIAGLNDLRSHAVERACSSSGRGLNRDEWTRYVPSLPFQNTCPT